MEYVYTALLLHSAKKPITKENVKKVLEAAGIEVDEGKLDALVASLENVDIDEVIKQGISLQAAPAEKKEEEKEKKEEEKEKKVEEAAAGLSALFG